MSYDFDASTTPKAKKDYVCEWCAEKIEKGFKHYKAAGVFEGNFQNWRMHLECRDAMHRDMKDDGEPYYLDGNKNPRGQTIREAQPITKERDL